MKAQPRQGQPHQPQAVESSTMDAVRLRRVNRWLAQGLGGELADLYVDSRERSAAEAYRSRSRLERVVRLLGYEAVWYTNINDLSPRARAWNPVTRHTFDGVVAGTDGHFTVVLLQVGED